MPFKLIVAQLLVIKSIYCIIKANGNKFTETYSKICDIHSSNIKSNHMLLIKVRNVLFISCMEH